jgi:EmrB/QacA subfamily drug resistance transporter
VEDAHKKTSMGLATAAVSEPAASALPRASPRLVLINVCLGLFMVALNQRALVVSLPTLTQVFHTSLATMQWAVLVYDLTLIGLVLTLGRLGDLFGRKRIYTGGYLLFALGSAVCGFAQSPAQLIVFRVLQAIGGSMLVANARAIVSVVVPVDQRGKALGLTSMAFHVGFLTGPTLGGFLIDTIGWRWNFFVNIPVGLAGAYFAWRILKDREKSEKKVSVDIQGALLLLVTTTSFLYAMNRLPHLGLGNPGVFSFFCVAVAALGVFIRTELRAKTPILSLALFRNRLFSAANLSLFFITSTQSAIGFLMPFYLQSLLGFTPTQMGWIIIANSVMIVIFAPLAGWLSDRLGSRLLCTIGSACIVTAQFFIASLDLDATALRVMIPLALTGLGWAMFNSPNQSAILGAVPKDKIGAALGMTLTTGRIGGASGIAFAAAIFTYGLAAAGLTHEQIESPQAWSAAPEMFLQSFNHTIHVINFFTLLSVFFSAVRGGKQPAHS